MVGKKDGSRRDENQNGKAKVSKRRSIIRFDSCPNCHISNGTIPKGLADVAGYWGLNIHRGEAILKADGKIAEQGHVYVECDICGFRTSWYTTLEECAKEWNSL